MANKRFTEAQKANALSGDEFMGGTQDRSAEQDGRDLQDVHLTPREISYYGASLFNGTIPVDFGLNSGVPIVAPQMGLLEATSETILFSVSGGLMVLIPFIRGSDEFENISKLVVVMRRQDNAGTTATGFANAIYDASDPTKLVRISLDVDDPLDFGSDLTFEMIFNLGVGKKLPPKFYIGFTVGITSTNTNIDFKFAKTTYTALPGYLNYYDSDAKIVKYASLAFVENVQHGLLPLEVLKADLKADGTPNAIPMQPWCAAARVTQI